MNAHAICSHEDNAASSDPSPHPRLCCVSFGTCEASYSALAGGAVSGSSPANNTVSESQDRMDRVRDASRTVEQSAIAPSECQTVSSPLHRRVGQNVDSASAAPRRAQSSPHDSSPTPLPVPPATMQRKTPMTPSATPSTCSPPPHTAPHVGAWAKMHNYDTVLAPCVRGIDARKGAGEAESVDTMDSSIGSSHMSNATATMITAIGSNATATANRMVDTSSEAIAAICVKEMYAIRTESVSLARLPSQSTASDSAMRLPVKRARSGEDEHDKEDNDSTPSSSLSSSQAPTAASLRTSPNTMGCSSIHTVPALPETRPTTHTIPVMWCPESTSLNKVPKLPKRVLRWTKMLQDVMSQEQQQQQQQQSEETTSEGVHAVCQRIAVSITGNEHEAKDTFLTLLVHLRDPENHLLRRRVLSGEIAVERLLGMAEHDLVNPERRRKMDLQFEERARDRNLTEMANAVRTTSRLFPCPACKARDCSWVQRQTRSGDEPMTIFCTCNKCKTVWKRY